jgi:uncharacterized protein with PIN domain
MLGKLTRWLRICGYDTEYVQYIHDDELIQRVADGGRILLTRDRLLYRKAVRAGEEAHLVIGKSDVEKLASVAIRFDLRLDAGCSLCPQCGASLTAVDKHLVSDRVPVRTFEVYDEFWICRSCSKVYWRGSHWRNIQNIVKSAEVMRFSADNGEQPL